MFRKIFLIFSTFTASKINYPSWYWGWKMNLVNFSLLWIFYALMMTCRVVKILSISLNECCNYLRVCQWMSSIFTSMQRPVVGYWVLWVGHQATDGHGTPDRTGQTGRGGCCQNRFVSANKITSPIKQLAYIKACQIKKKKVLQLMN